MAVHPDHSGKLADHPDCQTLDVEIVGAGSKYDQQSAGQGVERQEQNEDLLSDLSCHLDHLAGGTVESGFSGVTCV